MRFWQIMYIYWFISGLTTLIWCLYNLHFANDSKSGIRRETESLVLELVAKTKLPLSWARIFVLFTFFLFGGLVLPIAIFDMLGGKVGK